MNKRIVVFAPHADDEIFGCGGTIAKKLSDGYEIAVVYMTDGRHAFSKVFNINSEPTPDELREIRKDEARRAASIVGLQEENLIFLDFEDGALEQKTVEAQEHVIRILSKNQPVEVYFPYEKDIHPDHRATNRIVRNSIYKLGLAAVKYQYSIMQRYSRFRFLIRALLNLFKHNVVYVDISEFLPVKEAAIKEFESQIAIISCKQKRPIMENFERFLTNKEIFYLL